MTRPHPNLLDLWGYVYFLEVLLMILMCSLDENLLLKALCLELGIASVASLAPHRQAACVRFPSATIVPDCQHALPLSLPGL